MTFLRHSYRGLWGRRGGPSHLLGVLYMLASALAASTSGLFVRLVATASEWQVLSYRSLAFAGLFFIILGWRYGVGLPKAFIRIGWVGLGGAVCLGLTYIAYLTSMFLTSIAGAVIVFSLSPFFAGAFAAVLLREPPRPGNWLWMALALSGVAVMMLGSAQPRQQFEHPQLGLLVAMAAAFGYALAVVLLRSRRGHDLRPAFVLGGVVAFAISAAMAGDLAVPPRDAAVGVALGLVSLGLQYLFLERAARHLPADEITLLALAEVFISPLWVWIAVGEVPAREVVLGGTAVVLAVAGLSVSGARERWRAQAKSMPPNS